jgi:predicted DNA-binding transcriptional regulator YafY
MKRPVPASTPRPGRSGQLLSRPPIERMMRIHHLLGAGRHPNATDLATELEVSTKTILRDLEFMRDRMELPIEYSARHFGFHYTGPVEAFPNVQITEGELFALLVAEKALQQYRGTPYEKPLLAALRKLERTLPDTISLNLTDWEQTISFRTSAEPMLRLELIDQLARAATRRQELRLLYRKPNRKSPEERIVHPYHVANVNGDWYLFAFDLLRKSIRTFVPARIQEVQPTGNSFEPTDRFELAQLLRDSFGVHSGTEIRTVIVRFTPVVADYIREKRWHPSQELQDLPDGGVELRLQLGSLVEIRRWILGWGPDAWVIEPSELADQVRQAGRDIARLYADGPRP